MSADKSHPIAVLAPASRWLSGWAFGGLAVLLIVVSLASSSQQVSTVEMNRNDAACYLILARNIVQRGVYSLEQAEPFHPHTEWPPGIPLMYVPPMAIVGEFPLEAIDTAVIHAWALLLSVFSLWCVWRYLQEMTSPIGAWCVTAAVASTKAFLDSANAATADAVAVGFAFLALREIEVYFRDLSENVAAGRARLLPSRNTNSTPMALTARPPKNRIPENRDRGRLLRRWRTVGLHLLLASLPIVKPYLGLVFVAYLWKLLETRTDSPVVQPQISNLKFQISNFRSQNKPRRAISLASRIRGRVRSLLDSKWRARMIGVLAIGVCCLPFVGFIAYSVMAAEQQGTISAVTWLTTDNPTAIQEGVAATDQKTLGEWITGGLRTIRYFLLDNVSEAAVPVLRWFGFSDWPRVARFGVLGLVFGTLLAGVVRAVRQKQIAGLGYSAAMFAFFVVFACDSPRYFTVLTPMCALYFWMGLTNLLALIGRSKAIASVGRETAAAGFVLSVAVLAAGFWVEHRIGQRVDPEPFYREVYAALRAAQADETIVAIAVPYQLRSVATVETSKPVLSWEECVASKRHEWSRTAVLVIEDDSTGRFTRPLPAELAGTGSSEERAFEGQHVSLQCRVGP